MHDVERAIARIAGRQDNVISREQVLAVGLGRGAIAHRVATGVWQRRHRNVYLLGPAPPTLMARARAAAITCGADAVVSHRSAAEMFGLLPEMDADVHVTVAGRNLAPRDGVRRHRIAAFGPGVWTSLPPDFAGFGPQWIRAKLPSVARSPLLSSARPGPRGAPHPGMMVPGFPWMFIMYGPNTNTSGGSIVHHEAQARYITQALELVERHGGGAVEVGAEVKAASDRETEARVAGTAWTTCNSWYRDQGGRVVANWRGYTREYEPRTHELDLAEYRFVEPPRRIAA